MNNERKKNSLDALKFRHKTMKRMPGFALTHIHALSAANIVARDL